MGMGEYKSHGVIQAFLCRCMILLLSGIKNKVTSRGARKPERLEVDSGRSNGIEPPPEFVWLCLASGWTCPFEGIG